MPGQTATPITSPLARSLAAIRGIGPERLGLLELLEWRTILDLLLHRPRRYEDRRHVKTIASISTREPVMARGQIVALGVNRYSKGRKSVFEMILDDGTARLHCRWWNLPYMRQYFEQGDEVLVYGKPNWLKPRTIDHPETEIIEGGADSSIHLNRIAPIYPLTEGLTQRWVRSLIWRTLEEFSVHIAEPFPEELAPSFMARRAAIQSLHFPCTLEDATQARRRLALDELVQLQSAILERRKNLLAKAKGRPCAGDNRLIKQLLSRLGFKLTGAQTRVLRELRRDLGCGHPMRRLLQGDVGSGKTAVAACCALMTMESGFNVVLMAPTEVLAEQHFHNFSRWFQPLGIEVHLRTGSHKPTDMHEANSGQGRLHSGSDPVQLVIGTHALIEDAFTIEKLGLVVIDEQHRFGVAQREKLVRKGQYPHLLVMTATPIPRTLGLTLYGDLDISVIDEMPPGRAPVRTFVRTADRLPQIWEFTRSKLDEGKQAFLVFPRVEETSQGLKAVTKEIEVVQKELAPHRVGLLHGSLGASEKEAVMRDFRSNMIQALLCTSLIEVGIDVPNATVMLIENAEQFGLAQLHQLRGRIGRGSHESFCILVTHTKTRDSQERLRTLVHTADGFRIAEADLKLRGAGDFLGQQQSGLPPFRFVDLAEDLDLAERGRIIAKASMQSDPN
jgi:ATP-dependent DNA helicase RecG